MALAADSKASPEVRRKALNEVASGAETIAETCSSMLQREESLLIPVIAKVVPASEQKSFNNRVIRKLGVLDSRLHLVGMHEAVRDDAAEMALFQEMIPSIPRMMIPRWKRTIYEPRAGVLDEHG